ncbi:hypothetical protein [Nicoliella lavandulae]|uniref:DUF2269 family protein n=1 Tax=Nicoliella lavandulae TaxID=3082954 RepID=A0ABU8SJI0_9LACO
MLFYLILLSLAFVCPIIAIVVFALLAMKYFQLTRALKIKAQRLPMDDNQYQKWAWIQLVLLILLIVGLTFVKLSGTFGLIIIGLLVVIEVAVAIKTYLTVDPSLVDWDALHDRYALADDDLEMLVEKRAMMVRAIVILIMFLSISQTLVRI